MLTDAEEIVIAASAKQKSACDPRRNRQHFFNILEDFSGDVTLTGCYINLNAGQFVLAGITRQRGGECVGADFVFSETSNGCG